MILNTSIAGVCLFLFSLFLLQKCRSTMMKRRNAMNEAYKDSFFQPFENELPFLEFLREREDNGEWEKLETNAIKFHGLVEGETIANLLEGQFSLTGKGDIVKDTLDNTSLAAEFCGQMYLIRSTAIKTILQRANISGEALRKVKKPVLARILNDCIQIAKGSSLVRFTDGKISAVHSGDNSYSTLAIPELFQHTGDWLESNFPGYTFSGATFEHALVTALWELPDRDDLIKTYEDFLDLHGIEHKALVPALRLSTSDVGISGANLYPMLFSGKDKRIITLGNPIKLNHRDDADMEKFTENLESVFSMYQLAIGKLKDLVGIEIRNPINCMAGVMKKIGVSKKLAMEAIDFHSAAFGSDPCSAHDCYYGISHVIYLLQCEGATGSKIADMEEKVARALTIRWRTYDIPGELAW